MGKKTCKSKTFQKGDDYGALIEWAMSHITTNDYQPEGTASYGDNLSPHDPVSELDAKYIVTITKIED